MSTGIPKFRHFHRRGSALPEATRQCGMAGVARAKWSLEHHDVDLGTGEEEQMVLDLGLDGSATRFDSDD